MKKIAVLLAVLIALSALTPVAFAEQWESVNMVREEMLDRGFIGGEGCQWTNAIAISKTNPYFMMIATDVGGVFRSYDEGATWEECNKGLENRGACDIAIDPMNEKHILLYNTNSSPQRYCGIYMSVDGGDSWTQTFSQKAGCATDSRDQFVFDPTSYDEKTGWCMRVYYSTPSKHQTYGGTFERALYMSEDGGYTWEKIPNSDDYWNADLAMSDIGELYVGGEGGFFVSSDKGKTFQKTLDEWVLSVDYVSIEPNNVYVSTWKNIYISKDCGRTFEKIQADPAPPVYPKEPAENTSSDRFLGYRYFNVSPLNPNNMVIGAGMGSWNWQRWYSRDGGKSWYRGGVDYLENQTHYSTRNVHNAWSYLDENTVFSSGGDWITKSTNGGQIYRYWSQGISVYMGSILQINHNDPDKIFIAGIDYGSFASYDGGETWSFAAAFQNGRGGKITDGWVVDDEMAFAIVPTTEAELFLGRWKPHQRTVSIARGYHNLDFYPVEGLDPETIFCYQSATDKNVLFAGVLRSADKGETWQKMNGCRGVLTHNTDPNGQKELYGVNENSIVVSYDEGETWKKVVELEFSPTSMGYNWKKGYIYATKNDLGQVQRIDIKTNKITDIGKNVHKCASGTEIWDVEVDPVDPDVIYVSGPANYVMNTASVQRSVDGGDTFEILTRLHPDAVITEGPEGPGEGNAVNVHPVTREAWVTTNCYGVWKIGAPGSEVQQGEKLYAGQKNENVYLNWFGNGKYDLDDISRMAGISIYNSPHNEWYETIYEGFWDNATVHDEQELDVVAWYAFKEWENPIYAYEVQKSTDGKNFETIKTTNDTEFTDTDVDEGDTYYYKVVNMHNGKTTVTKTVTVK